MGRLLAIDYGHKRTGIASTDSLQLIASPLTTVNTSELFHFFKTYMSTEEVDKLIVGMPKNLNNEDTHSTAAVRTFIEKFKSNYNITVVEVDERFSSKMAFQTMIDGGLTKKNRKNKETIDKISAAIILQSYMDSPASK